MYSYLHETDDSTTVNFSAYGKFLPGSNTGNQLVTIGGKYVRVFRTNPYALVPPKDGSEDWQQKTRLECIFSTRMLGCVRSFAVARLPSHPYSDAFLMAFDDAKLSIVAIEEKSRSLTTLSMHSFEDEFLREGNTKNFPAPIVIADPSNRCAAMLVYGKHLAVFPFVEGQSYIRSFNVPLSQIDSRLDNVVDVVFLDGYYEPTLLFLYEPLQTTAGRSSIRYDTMCIMGVSVNVADKQFAVVWQLGSLPMDGNRLLAVPKPIGGAIVFGANEVIYLNQAVPPNGIALNSCYDHVTKFPLKDMKSLCMTLEVASPEWLGNGRVAIGTLDGRLFILTLTADSANTVKGLTLEHVFDCSAPYCMSACAPGHLFLGSRLGDSQFLEYTITTKKSEKAESEAKKPRVDPQFDEEDLELYGDGEVEDVEEQEEETVVEWQFTELDRLKNIGPVKTVTAGGAHDTSPLLLEGNRVDPVFDLVTASGHGKDGSLCVFQRTVRPEVITSSSLESAQQMWAVGQHEDGSHKYLIVSRIRSTLVLELGEEMVELEDPLFITSEPTVAAGELADGGLAVQVTSMCMALVADGRQLQEIQLDSNFPVVAASIVDPYVALLTQNGRLLLFQLAVQPHVHLKEVDLSSTPFASVASAAPLTAISIYKDMSGIMICSTGRSRDNENAGGGNKQKGPVDDLDADLYGDSAMDDDEDLLLYGGSTAKTKNTEPETSRKRKRAGIVTAATGGEESDAIDPNTVEPTYWLVLARDNGKMIIHSLPDMTVVFQVRKFGGMPELLVDMTEEEDEKEKKEFAAEQERRAKEGEGENVREQTTETVRQDERIVELHIIGMGISQCRPILMAVVDDMVIVYEMYSIPNAEAEHLCVAFRRQPLTICLRSSPYMGYDGRRTEVQIGRESERHRSIIHPFDRISSVMHGVLIGGTYPCLVLVGAWGGLRHHPLTMDGPLRSFTPFNNQNIANGFLYLTDVTQELRIAKLQSEFDYEMPYPCKKVHVGATVHHIRYMMQSQVYAVTTSVPKPCNKIWVVVNDDKQEEVHEKGDQFVLPTIPQYTLSLYSPEDWGKVPNTDMDMEDMETITACEEVALRSESTLSGMQTYIAVGTINNYGEEHLVRGRIIIGEIIEVVPEPGLPTSKHKIKKLYDVEQKGPVTALTSVNGFLLSGMGQKIFIWGFKDNELQGISFLDMHYYVHSLVGLRNMALACDMQASLSLVRFQEQFKALSIASRDDRLGIQPPLQAQYLVDKSHVAFLLSDEAGNICMFNYMPEMKESVGGEKLVLRGILNIGTNVNAWIRVKGNTSLCGVSVTEAKQVAQEQTTVWMSLDGSVGFVRPINEKSFRRLSFLHQFMTIGVRHAAGLNPKGARSAHPPRPIINAANHRNMVDGDVVSQFMHLSTADKQDIARRLGASRYHIMDDLVQIQRLSTYY